LIPFFLLKIVFYLFIFFYSLMMKIKTLYMLSELKVWSLENETRVFFHWQNTLISCYAIYLQNMQSPYIIFSQWIILSILSTGFCGFWSASESSYESWNTYSYFYDSTVIDYHVHIISSYLLEVLYFIKTCIFDESLKINQ